MGSQIWALMQHVLQHSPPDSVLCGMSKIHLLWRALLISGLVLASLVFVFEPDALKPDHLIQGELWLHVFFIAIFNLLRVYSSVQLVEKLSAVAFNVLAAIYQLPFVLMGVLLQDDQVSPGVACGLTLNVLGAVVYAWARRVEPRLSADQLNQLVGSSGGGATGARA